MAAPLLYQVKFKAGTALPAIETILLDAIDVTNLAVVATSRLGGGRNILWQLTAKREGKMPRETMRTLLFDMGDEKREYILEGSIFDVRSHYLIGSVLFVLMQLGGIYDDPLPDWAGKPWRAVRADWNKSAYFINPAEF